MWVSALGIATLLGFSSAGMTYAGRKLAGLSVTFGYAMSTTLPDWYYWAWVAPLVVFLARRFPIGRRRWVRNGAVHLVTGSLVAVLVLVIMTSWQRLLVGVSPFHTYPALLFYVTGLWFHYQLFIYWAIVLGTLTFDYHRQYRARDVETARLETELVRAQLQALRSQINPHFLFNSLHTIAMLMRERRVREAIDMIAGLGELFRKSLDRSSSQLVPLSDEIETARAYLAIEQIRFGDRLRVRFDVDSAALAALVPSLLLQPLLENSVRHGIGMNQGGGRIDIEARIHDGDLLLRVRDDGPGLIHRPEGAGPHRGLANTRLRLEYLYGSAQRLEASEADGGGADVIVLIPFHMASRSLPAALAW